MRTNLRDKSNQQNNSSRSRTSFNNPFKSKRDKNPTKVFDDDEGEYVDFDEV